jgi:hypothetical protein
MAGHITPAGQDAKPGLKNLASGAMQASQRDQQDMRMAPRINIPDTESNDDPAVGSKDDTFFQLPESVRKMKTLKLPEGLPRSEAQMQVNPVMGQMMHWFMFPLGMIFFIVSRYTMDPFNEGETAVHPTQRKDFQQPVHKVQWGEVPEATLHDKSDAERRRQLRAQLD